MNEPLTSRMIFDQINTARDEANKVDADVRAFTAQMLRAKHEFEIAKDNHKLAEANAFAEAKEAGGTEGYAARIAIRKTQVELEILRDKRTAYEDAKAKKEASERLASMWTEFVKSYASTSYSLNRELKVLEGTG